MDVTKKIVIACDSFKGCLDTFEVAEAVECGILEQDDSFEIVKLALADGGEGTAEVITKLFNGQKKQVESIDSLGRKCPGWYGQIYIDDVKTAVVDVATVNGLPLIPPESRNPLISNTIGTGIVIKSAIEEGIKHFIIGLGGSATIDGGIGILYGLGYRFTDKSGRELEPTPVNLTSIKKILPPRDYKYNDCKFTLLSDVETPMAGESGCAFVYGPQKGAGTEDVELLNKGLENLIRVIQKDYNVDLNNCKGSGAAGGIAGTLHAVLNAEILSGSREILHLIKFKDKIQDASLIITGEGRIDTTTFEGKAPYIVMQEASRYGFPTIAICGSVGSYELIEKSGFEAVFPVTPDSVPLKEAMKPDMAKEFIKKTVSEIVRLY